jgi:HAD superfamily hydrolase (TIGR01509 family)
LHEAIEAVLFDFDGVLADSEPVHCECWSIVLEPLGISLTWEIFEKHCVGKPDLWVAHFVRGLADPKAEFEAVWSLHPRKTELFLERMTANPPITEEVRGLLGALGAYKLGVVTASDKAEIEPVLRAAGIRGHFDVVVCAGDVVETKPAPDPYLLAMRRLGVIRALAVEDSESGAESARRAGLEVVRVGKAQEMPALVAARLAIFR